MSVMTNETIALSPYLPPNHQNYLLEKLIVAQTVKKLPAFYGTRKFITAFTKACHYDPI
jgi:hypothetical protein